MYAVTKANVRSGPDASTESLGKLEEGEKIFAVELTEEGWYRVVFQGETGYVRQDLLAVYKTQAWEDAADDEENRQWEIGAPMPEDISQESIDTEKNPTEDSSGEEPDKGEASKQKDGVVGGQDISIFVILAAVAAIVLLYGAMLIVKEKRQADTDAPQKKPGNHTEESGADGIEDIDHQDDAEWIDDWYDEERAEDTKEHGGNQ